MIYKQHPHGLFPTLEIGLSLLQPRPLILHGLRPIHSLILPKAMSLINIVGVLIIRTISSLDKVNLIHGFSQLVINSALSQPMHNSTFIIGWEWRCSDGDFSLSYHECLNLQCQSLLFFPNSVWELSFSTWFTSLLIILLYLELSQRLDHISSMILMALVRGFKMRLPP